MPVGLGEPAGAGGARAGHPGVRPAHEGRTHDLRQRGDDMVARLRDGRHRPRRPGDGRLRAGLGASSVDAARQEGGAHDPEHLGPAQDPAPRDHADRHDARSGDRGGRPQAAAGALSQRADLEAGGRDAAHRHRRRAGRPHGGQQHRPRRQGAVGRTRRGGPAPHRPDRRSWRSGRPRQRAGRFVGRPGRRGRADGGALRARTVRSEFAVQDRRVRPRRRAVGPQPLQGHGHGRHRRRGRAVHRRTGRRSEEEERQGPRGHRHPPHRPAAG